METMVVVAILSMVFGTVLYFLVVGRDAFFISNAKISLQQDLRRCLRRMVEELSEGSIDNVVDQNNNPLNFVQKDEEEGILKCIPQNSECVYYVVKFKKPISWNSQGEVDGWSDYVTYTLSSGGITRQEGSSSPVNLVSSISLVRKAAGHGYTYDPNSLGSGFERLSSNRIKISLVAQRESHGRTLRVDIGSNVYLRN